MKSVAKRPPQGQLLCKICSTRFSPDESRFSSVKLRCTHCGNSLVPKKERKHFIIHKCINPKCPYYLYNLGKVDREDLREDYGRNKYKLHYIKFIADGYNAVSSCRNGVRKKAGQRLYL